MSRGRGSTAVVTREEAIAQIAGVELGLLSPEQRAEQLWIMSEGENWSEAAGWSTLDGALRQEFVEGPLAYDAAHPRYDPVLLLWLRETYVGATNAHLRARLQTLGITETEISGEPEALAACPCCGARSISDRGEYDICPVCRWEDDGADNDAADRTSGPNHLSLTQARANFLLHGICDPTRTDLRGAQHPPTRYERGRRFALSEGGRRVYEVDGSWAARLPERT